MQNNLRRAYFIAAMLIGGTTLASAQGGSTDPRGNAVGSEHVGNGAAANSGGAMHSGAHATTGMSGARSGKDSPNGSPNAAPTAKQGPAGDPSRASDAPK